MKENNYTETDEHFSSNVKTYDKAEKWRNFKDDMLLYIVALPLILLVGILDIVAILIDWSIRWIELIILLMLCIIVPLVLMVVAVYVLGL